MPSNVVTLKAVSNSILTAPQFLQELTALKAADSKARSKAAKQRAVQKKQELRQLSLEASADWNRVLNRISNSILDNMLDRRWPEYSIGAQSLLGKYGIKNSRRRVDNLGGLLERALRAENLLRKWQNKRYVNGKYSLVQFVINEYQIGKFNDLKPQWRSYGAHSRYYDVSDSKMASINKKKDTFVYAILSEVESILSANGYIVKNTVRLAKWKKTKSTVHYAGYLNIIAQ